MKFGKFVGLILLVFSAFLLWRIRFVVLLGFLAVVLATIINRVVRLFTRLRLKRGWAIALTYLLISGIVAGVLAVAVPPFVEQVRAWLVQAPYEASQIRRWVEQLDEWVPFELSTIGQQLDMFISDIPRIARSLFDNFFSFFTGTLSLLLNTFLVLAVTTMLLANPRAYRKAFVALFPHFYRLRIQEILDGCESALAGWGIGILFNMAVIMLMSFVGLMVIGVPLPIANASIAGVLTFIPNVGPVLSVIPPAILALLESPWKAAAVVVLYVVIQQLESNFLTPLVMNHQVSLLPAATLLFQLVFGLLFGFFGLFLALPIVVVGQVWLEEVLVKDIMNTWQKPSPVDNYRTTQPAFVNERA
ncbi:AI-2E family transporter [Oscillatoria sp. CS-180]|uniref:AI-2E family transporter n=1 Tax=Oscillatoria sp. CS-180 TaxID=3021720 RepID=UPI00232B831F|nr:AI-2E family transporter [Oscillatoria sp. CS-180]MDB9527825.1 AI-2E family transporter [Oscillatoria sp. CS-180]